MLYEGIVLPLIVAAVLFGGYYERVIRSLYLLVYIVLLSRPLILYLVVVFGFGGSLKLLEPLQGSGAW